MKSLLYLYMIRQATSKFNNPLKLRPGWVTFSGNKKPFTNKVDTQGKFPPLLIPCLKCLKKKNPKKGVIMIQIIDKELSSIRYLLAFTHAFDFNYSYWYSYVNIAPIELKSYNVIIQFERDLVIFFFGCSNCWGRGRPDKQFERHGVKWALVWLHLNFRFMFLFFHFLLSWNWLIRCYEVTLKDSPCCTCG